MQIQQLKDKQKSIRQFSIDDFKGMNGLDNDLTDFFAALAAYKVAPTPYNDIEVWKVANYLLPSIKARQHEGFFSKLTMAELIDYINEVWHD